MKKVITFGVYDYFHLGHLRLFKRCREYGDYLIVAVHKDEYVKINKPDCSLYYTDKERMEIVESLSCVDEVIFYTQIDETIKDIDFDVLVIGPDQTNMHFKNAIKFCKDNKKEVVVVPRTPNISSTEIKLFKHDK